MHAPNKVLFYRAVNAMTDKADSFAELCHVTMGHVNHTWQGNAPTKADVYGTLLHLIAQLKFDPSKTYYVASTGGLHVELVFWPESGPTARIYYSPLQTPATFDTQLT
jgi:hypothetical protein